MLLIKRFIGAGVSFFLSVSFVCIFIISQNTLWNLFWLQSQNFDISFLILFSSLAHDIKGGVSPIILQWGIPISFYTVISITLLLAFIITFLIRLRFPINSKFSYAIAGFTSMYVMMSLIIMKYDGIVLISSARENFGLFVFCFIGLLGGFFFDTLISNFLKRGN